eukprot:TRINITY_DN15650_c0_g1_i2.p3 TRINITY_DN15650_c0_g1~~TRINITY_DN15650_c0_g1_i2.p3  ORF type:complete len:285 (+),score=37.77 TRINITY_DN15650_c0_g1_i2:105-959(+)
MLHWGDCADGSPPPPARSPPLPHQSEVQCAPPPRVDFGALCAEEEENAAASAPRCPRAVLTPRRQQQRQRPAGICSMLSPPPPPPPPLSLARGGTTAAGRCAAVSTSGPPGREVVRVSWSAAVAPPAGLRDPVVASCHVAPPVPSHAVAPAPDAPNCWDWPNGSAPPSGVRTVQLEVPASPVQLSVAHEGPPSAARLLRPSRRSCSPHPSVWSTAWSDSPRGAARTPPSPYTPGGASPQGLLRPSRRGGRSGSQVSWGVTVKHPPPSPPPPADEHFAPSALFSP